MLTVFQRPNLCSVLYFRWVRQSVSTCKNHLTLSTLWSSLVALSFQVWTYLEERPKAKQNLCGIDRTNPSCAFISAVEFEWRFYKKLVFAVVCRWSLLTQEKLFLHKVRAAFGSQKECFRQERIACWKFNQMPLVGLVTSPVPSISRTFLKFFLAPSRSKQTNFTKPELCVAEH